MLCGRSSSATVKRHERLVSDGTGMHFLCRPHVLIMQECNSYHARTAHWGSHHIIIYRPRTMPQFRSRFQGLLGRCFERPVSGSVHVDLGQRRRLQVCRARSCGIAKRETTDVVLAWPCQPLSKRVLDTGYCGSRVLVRYWKARKRLLVRLTFLIRFAVRRRGII